MDESSAPPDCAERAPKRPFQQRIVRSALVRIGVRKPSRDLAWLTGAAAIYTLISAIVAVLYMLSPDALCLTGAYDEDGRTPVLAPCNGDMVSAVQRRDAPL